MSDHWIDKDKLKQLAEDPEVTAREIYAAFGYKNDVTFYAHINQDPELRRTYHEGRALARESAKETRGSQKKSTKASRKKSSRKSAKANTPPPQWECQRREQRVLQTIAA